LTTGLAVLIGEERSDPLILPLAEKLARHDVNVELIEPGLLATSPVSVTVGGAWLKGTPITAAVFRATSDACLADSFCDDDRSFANAETRSIWLHVLSLPSIRCVNRSDAELWFALQEWPVWRGRFAAAGVLVSPLAVGDVSLERPGSWLHWGGGTSAGPTDAGVRRAFCAAVAGTSNLIRSVWCCGRVIGGPTSNAIERAGHVLRSHGIVLASIDADASGNVVTVTTRPVMSPAISEPAAEHLAAYLAA
jgi:hypothetical protein